MTHYGVDLSSNNSHPLPYAAIAAYLQRLGEGAQPFAIIKASEGDYYTNVTYYAADVAGFKAAGVAVGAYYMAPGNSTPEATVQTFQSFSGGLPPFLDIEQPAGLSTSAYIAHVQQVLALLPSPVYLNQSEVAEGFPEGEGLWLADYDGPTGTVPYPSIAHQYTSGGYIPGATGVFDLSVWTGTEAQFQQFFSSTHPTPTPTPKPSGGDVQLPTLNQGAHGGYVKSVQSLLRTKAAQNIIVDGNFGPATAAAVENVQRFFHLTVDGVVGPVTWSVLLGF